MSIPKYIYLNPEWQKANIVDINEEIKQTFDFFSLLNDNNLVWKPACQIWGQPLASHTMAFPGDENFLFK